MIRSVAERIDGLSIPEPNSGCWLWLGVLADNGYGRIGVQVGGNWRVKSAHRVSWIEANGDIPEGMSVLHRCDVRCCVNPDHLFLGTQLDNMRDMHAKGRYTRVPYKRGEDHSTSKLTEAQALYILSSEKRTVDLAKEIGVTQACISSLRNGYTWKHLRQKENAL